MSDHPCTGQDCLTNPPAHGSILTLRVGGIGGEVDCRIEVSWQTDLPDVWAVDLLIQVAQLDLDIVRRAQVSDLYFSRGDLSLADLECPVWLLQQH